MGSDTPLMCGRYKIFGFSEVLPSSQTLLSGAGSAVFAVELVESLEQDNHWPGMSGVIVQIVFSQILSILFLRHLMVSDLTLGW